MGQQRGGKTLFVGGLSIYTHTKDLASEFERYGELSRCDIPTPGGRPRGYAFVEFKDDKSAEDAFEGMKNRKIDGREISLQWAKRSPARGWSSSFRSRRSRSRSPSRSRSRSPGRMRRQRDNRDNRDRRHRRRSRSASPRGRRSRSRSRSPRRKGSYQQRSRRSPSPRSPAPRSEYNEPFSKNEDTNYEGNVEPDQEHRSRDYNNRSPEDRRNND